MTLMQTSNPILNYSELVEMQGGKPVTTSRKVAKTFGKQHKNVLRDIKRTECSNHFKQSNFAAIDFKDSYGRTQTEYLITKDGFMFLVMGFTGKQAALFKEEYINAFNEMEVIIKQDLMYGEAYQDIERFLDAKEQHDGLCFYTSGIKCILEGKKFDIKLHRLNKSIDKRKRGNANNGIIPLNHTRLMTVREFADKFDKDVDLKLSQNIGRIAMLLCAKKRLPVEKVPDETYTEVGAYPEEVLKEVYDFVC